MHSFPTPSSSRPRLLLAGIIVALAGLLVPAAAQAKPKSHPPKAPKAAKPSLGVAFVKPPTLTEGTQAKVAVRVVNKGRRPLRKVVVTAKGGKGVTVAPASGKARLLRPRKARTFTFGVTVAAGTKSPTLSIAGKAKGVAAAAKKSLTLKIVPAPPPPPPPPPPNPLIGRYFFNSTLIVGTTYVNGYYFVDDKFVYRGIPDGGLPACSAQTAEGDKDGCLPYTYDATSGALNVAGVTGEFKVDSHLLKVGEDSFSEIVPAEAGTKIDASGNYINGYGVCPYCTFVSIGLELTSAGEFAKSSAISGSTPSSDFAALPPDQHGTYVVDARGHIVFTYADGHVVAQTFAILLDKSNNPDPNYGMLLDDSVFFGPHSDV